MSFQLIVQLRGETIIDFDAMVELENELIAVLDETADVDGHDIGSGETNIFIFTSNPSQTFHDIKPILEHMCLLESSTVAFRPSEGGSFKIIWPEVSNSEFHLA